MKLSFFVFLFFIIFPVTKVFAAEVVINEIFANPENEDDEFLELYNTTEAEIDLENWKISDKVETFILSGKKIAAKSFLAIEKSESGITLNNSDEEVTLKNNNDEIVDNYIYANTIEGKSWSRVPDGTGVFANNTEVTKGFENASPPTPTPSNTPTPTRTPTPTKTPTPTDSPSPTTLQKQTEDLIEKVTPASDVKSKVTSGENSDLKLASEYSNDILGEEDEEENPNPDVLGENISSTSMLFIGLGLIFLAVCAILAYFQFGDKIWAAIKKKNENDGLFE